MARLPGWSNRVTSPALMLKPFQLMTALPLCLPMVTRPGWVVSIAALPRTTLPPVGLAPTMGAVSMRTT